MTSLALAVIAGLFMGSIFVAALAVQFYPRENAVLFDKIDYPTDRRHGDEMLEIIGNNATIADRNKHRYLTVFYISDMHEAGENCPFGSCGRVLVDTRTGVMHIYVNFEKGFVAGCFEQKGVSIYYAIYNCGGERLGGLRLSVN